MGSSRLTPAEAIRAMCLQCLSAANVRGGYDCLSPTCPLYAAQPFRGVPPPPSVAPEGSPEWEADQEKRAHRARRKRQPTKRLIAETCKACQGPYRADCRKTECALYYYRPCQPGGQPRGQRRTRPAPAHRTPSRAPKVQDT